MKSKKIYIYLLAVLILFIFPIKNVYAETYFCSYTFNQGKLNGTAKFELNSDTGEMSSAKATLYIDGSTSNIDLGSNNVKNWNSKNGTGYSAKDYYNENLRCTSHMMITSNEGKAPYEIVFYSDSAVTTYNGKTLQEYKAANSPEYWADSYLNETNVPRPTDDYGDETCEGIFSAEVLDFIQDIFNIIKIIAPILVMVLSSLDFIKAIAMQDKDAHKKAFTNLIKRLILAASLFFLPIIINLLLDLVNNSWGTCEIS